MYPKNHKRINVKNEDNIFKQFSVYSFKGEEKINFDPNNT